MTYFSEDLNNNKITFKATITIIPKKCIKSKFKYNIYYNHIYLKYVINISFIYLAAFPSP